MAETGRSSSCGASCRNGTPLIPRCLGRAIADPSRTPFLLVRSSSNNLLESRVQATFLPSWRKRKYRSDSSKAKKRPRSWETEAVQRASEGAQACRLTGDVTAKGSDYRYGHSYGGTQLSERVFAMPLPRELQKLEIRNLTLK